jgi:hypothetical protein
MVGMNFRQNAASFGEDQMIGGLHSRKTSLILADCFSTTPRPLLSAAPSPQQMAITDTVASNEVRTSAVSTGVGPLSVAVSKRVSPLCKPVSAPKSWHECCAVTEIPADETLKIFFSAS